MLRINTNVAAINTLRAMHATDLGLTRSLEQLSSGLRVNRASDDAAGLSISENLNAQVRGGQQASRNILDGLSLVNLAEGALNEIHAILQRMETLAVQASNGTLAPSDRNAAQGEFGALQAEIGNISTNTSFDGVSLFSGVAGGFTSGGFGTVVGVGSASGTSTFALNGPPAPLSPSALNSLTITATSTASVGPPAVPAVTTTLTAGTDYTVTQTPQGFNGTTPLYSYSVTMNNSALAGSGPYTVTANANMNYPTSTLPLPIVIQSGANFGETETLLIPPVNAPALGVGSISLTSQSLAMTAIANVQAAIATVAGMRGGLGASANRLEHSYNNVQVGSQDQLASYSRIRDADMADQMATLTRQQIMMQGSTRMLAIANNTDYLARLLSA